jgi:hypothetical protein
MSLIFLVPLEQEIFLRILTYHTATQFRATQLNSRVRRRNQKEKREKPEFLSILWLAGAPLTDPLMEKERLVLELLLSEPTMQLRTKVPLG